MSILGVMARACLVGAGMLCGLAFMAVFALIQSLPKAQIDVHGSVLAPPDPPVTVTIRRSGSYGLTASERAAGWEPLNEPVEERAPLTESFSATLPPASYCVTRPIWADVPPPPVVFTLSFSDAPDEEYTVVRIGKHSTYFVRDTAGLDLPAELASWRLEIGELNRKAEGYPSVWSLELRVERQQSPLSEVIEPAAA